MPCGMRGWRALVAYRSSSVLWGTRRAPAAAIFGSRFRAPDGRWTGATDRPVLTTLSRPRSGSGRRLTNRPYGQLVAAGPIAGGRTCRKPPGNMGANPCRRAPLPAPPTERLRRRPLVSEDGEQYEGGFGSGDRFLRDLFWPGFIPARRDGVRLGRALRAPYAAANTIVTPAKACPRT